MNSLKLTLFCLLPAASIAAELQPVTLQAWEEYVRTVNLRMPGRVHEGGHFLWMSESTERMAKVHAGQVIVEPMVDPTPHKVPGGLIHHWIGAEFIPNVTLNDTVATVRDYARYTEFYPAVIAAKSVTKGDAEDEFSMILMNKVLVQKTALESQNVSSLFPVNDKQWYCLSRTVHIQEIKDYGQAGETKLPEGRGTGYIWRLAGITRLEQVDGGVFVELEAMALTRDIPGSLRVFVMPIVRRVSKSSVVESLLQTKKAVTSPVSASLR